jgi:hypothetical protein
MNPRIVAHGIPDLLPMVRSGAANSHVSAIIRSLCVQLGHFEDDSATESTPKEKARRQTMWELGSSFEDALVSALVERYIKNDPNRYARVGELAYDGLLGTPDLVDLTDFAVIEVKLTWMSSRHDAHSEKFWKYWVQLKAYCMMLGTRLGRLHVCHINGNYRDDRGPVYNVWEDEFTERELTENWLMLTRHAKTLK